MRKSVFIVSLFFLLGSISTFADGQTRIGAGTSTDTLGGGSASGFVEGSVQGDMARLEGSLGKAGDKTVGNAKVQFFMGNQNGSLVPICWTRVDSTPVSTTASLVGLGAATTTTDKKWKAQATVDPFTFYWNRQAEAFALAPALSFKVDRQVMDIFRLGAQVQASLLLGQGGTADAARYEGTGLNLTTKSFIECSSKNMWVRFEAIKESESSRIVRPLPVPETITGGSRDMRMNLSVGGVW